MRSSAPIMALLVSGLVGLGCGNSGTSTGTRASDARTELAVAARVSANVGAHFVFAGSMAEHGRETKLKGTGEVEAGGRRDHLEVESGGVHIEQFTTGSFLLLNASVFAGVRAPLPPGTRWVKIDQGRIAQAAGVDLRSFQQLQNLDPAGQLRTYLKLATDVRRQGPANVRGAPAVRYRLTISGGKIVEQLGPGATPTSKPSPRS